VLKNKSATHMCSFAHFFIPILADYLRPCLFNILFISQKAAPQGLLLIAN